MELKLTLRECEKPNGPEDSGKKFFAIVGNEIKELTYSYTPRSFGQTGGISVFLDKKLELLGVTEFERVYEVHLESSQGIGQY